MAFVACAVVHHPGNIENIEHPDHSDDALKSDSLKVMKYSVYVENIEYPDRTCSTVLL